MSPLGVGDEGGLGISVQIDDVTDRRDAQNQLQELALQDPFTSLAEPHAADAAAAVLAARRR